MSVEKILGSWKKQSFKPNYWLEGEEEYYIDEVMNFAEHSILSEADAQFNLTIFYGKDADWAAIINACRRYPMFADKQVVLLKEAQQMDIKNLEKLEAYIEKPLTSTIFVVGYKGKSVDKRTRFHKTIQANAEVLTTKKIAEGKMHDWIIDVAKEKGFTIQTKAASLLEEHVGNDLSRLANEIDKISINLKDKKNIDENDIEKFIGISKEYNVFELQASIAKKDLTKSLKIINYFEHNPKAGAIHMVLPVLYSFFSKVYAVYGSNNIDAGLKQMFFNYAAQLQAKDAMKNYGYGGIEKIILLFHQYDLKGKGIGDLGTNGALLMKEMLVKIMVNFE